MAIMCDQVQAGLLINLSFLIIIIIYSSGLSHLLHKLGLSIICQLWLSVQCYTLHATWRGGCVILQNQRPLSIVRGNQGVPEGKAQQWVGTHVYHIAGTTRTAVAARQRRQTSCTWRRIISQLSLAVKVNARSNDGWCTWNGLRQTFMLVTRWW